MFKLLRWAFLLVVFTTVIGFVFLLGLSFGLSNNHDKFITETVPVLSMLGGWVAGIGALAAVLTTLWLADKQRREDVENLKVSLVMGMLSYGPRLVFASVNVTADGKRPAIITSITFMSPYANHAVHVTGFMDFGNSLPTKLNYGEQAQFPFEFGLENTLNKFVRDHCGGRSKGLEVVVSTSLNEFRKPVPPSMLSINSP